MGGLAAGLGVARPGRLYRGPGSATPVLRAHWHLSALSSPRGGRMEATCSPRPGFWRNILRAFSILGGSPESWN